MEFITKSASETKSLGEKIAVDLAISHQPLVIALTGNLGSGKTTFVQGFAKGLGLKARIISPTFILMRKYGENFYHVDLYRLEGNIESEVRNLGIEDIWKDPKNIVVIEWAEKIKKMIPKSAQWIKFENLGKDERKITINH
ncbi:tRNA (adenosine(37)-N6)-threonylcarbamoyltransferase complex ATPase subunit type 1 TsaE [Candidatus Woesebacteria bacterium RIFOXYA1_FULL_40_18]|uniref:tRNA threonylcarbamoyladenosine biosynthesis protein TsaE n=1 Tax=Candidatus Woesebacteria bacterium RIFOXYA1_FULL_40_18 TaxID=1802532 RepID=A0A1F8CJL3_9BACT|nr:MAG: tRNA (adenosine(37)-N6)-threonylcarbamoyltransferase complex ATPase subunit type 1 TsaE [Candidatus Woesebacteria bacterium RIFOXYA1_FULL_40_18]